MSTVKIRVRAHPGASRERLEWDGEVLHVWVSARAAEGAANRALLKSVARALDVPASAARLVAGERGRDKLVEVKGASASRLQALRHPSS